jgi:hypothetical protein
MHVQRGGVGRRCDPHHVRRVEVLYERECRRKYVYSRIQAWVMIRSL